MGLIPLDCSYLFYDFAGNLKESVLNELIEYFHNSSPNKQQPFKVNNHFSRFTMLFYLLELVQMLKTKISFLAGVEQEERRHILF